jgi:5-methylcytosine-specific restriction endonuclease McrA
VNLYSKKHALKFKEKRVAQKKAHSITEAGRRSKRKSSESQRSKFPEKTRAVKHVWSAIRSGKLKRPESCSHCGEKAKTEAHHHDYSKPLDVAFLCKKCHGIIHRKKD